MSLNHSFSVELAERYGIECAILIQHFQFWIEQNQAMNRNYYDNRTWMYQTQQEIAAIYPYWNRDKVQDLIQKLVDYEVIIKGNYNKKGFDKTTWYAFKNEEMFTKVRNRTMESGKPHNGEGETAQPIPDTSPDTSPDKQQQRPAAVLPKQKKKDINPHLLLIQIPDTEKRWISERYDDHTIKHAVAFATHPGVKIKTSLEQTIKWACVNKPEIPKEQAAAKPDPTSPEQIFANRVIVKEFQKKIWSNLEFRRMIDDKVDYAQVGNDRIYYKDTKFRELFEHACRKVVTCK